MEKQDLVTEIQELKNQLSYSKNIGFFFGAGSSCALGLPNIKSLTTETEARLKQDLKPAFKIVHDSLKKEGSVEDITIENILNQVRLIREITSDSNIKNYEGVTGAVAKELDINICKEIYSIINEKEKIANISNTKKFFAWLNMLNGNYSKEVFTTNYDLIIEKALEANKMPYFDGFVGSVEPFFWQESVDAFVTKNDLTQNWVRLWKIHGSLNWLWKLETANNEPKTHRIIRTSKNNDAIENELVIYPSKEKYDLSRKQPFVSYFDRLKNYLLSGELLFVFTGYSFSDQHINEIIFNCLRQNSRLFVLIFFYSDSEVEKIKEVVSSYLNVNVFGPTKAIINGKMVEWSFDETKLKSNEKIDNIWSKTENQLLLGDFNKLVDFLIENSGRFHATGDVSDDR